MKTETKDFRYVRTFNSWNAAFVRRNRENYSRKLISGELEGNRDSLQERLAKADLSFTHDKKSVEESPTGKTDVRFKSRWRDQRMPVGKVSAENVKIMKEGR